MKTKLNQIDAQGRRQGLWKQYWLNGNLWAKGSYLDGKETGAWEWYRKNGNLWAKESFLNGKRTGSREDYDREGNLIKVTYYH